ncbi:mannosyltransferase APTG1-like [Rhodamnia argentea]|uniref:Mannosyltransferase APTG1-like n=1 Tax=Rhodamnia argentea TaxID=178133 RepID=A0ABM3HVY1_9MYRT|nr:mannosyltransferase APTG1-like [Rhodamnia argentea]
MNFLSREAAKDRVKSILFLMPCHATPCYSTLHRDLPMCFLDCLPSEERGVPDESDHFTMDPVGFTEELANDWAPLSHIVLFESEERALREFLLLHSFKEVKGFFLAHFKVACDLQSSVVVYALTGSMRYVLMALLFELSARTSLASQGYRQVLLSLLQKLPEDPIVLDHAMLRASATSSC